MAPEAPLGTDDIEDLTAARLGVAGREQLWEA